MTHQNAFPILHAKSLIISHEEPFGCLAAPEGGEYMEILRSLSETLKDYQAINDAEPRLRGYSRDEIIGTNYKTYVNPESAKYLDRCLQQGLSNRYARKICS